MTGRPWPLAGAVRLHEMRGVHYCAAMADERRTFVGQGTTADEAETAAWSGYRIASDPEHVHDFDPHDRQDGSGQCSSCGMWDSQAFEVRRTIDYGRYAIAEHWPAEWHVSGGSLGVVFSRDGSGSRSTAFFEVYPRDPDTFVRGEGESLAQAEAAAWEKVQRLLACPAHEFETRGYTNGAGFCRHCGMFASGVFDVAVVGNPCIVCGARTNWSQVTGDWYCKEHVLPRAMARALREEARRQTGSSGDGFLNELFEELSAQEDDDAEP